MDLNLELPQEIPSDWHRLKTQCSWQSFFCVSFLILLTTFTIIYAIVASLQSSNTQDCIINLPIFEIKYDQWMKVYAYTNLVSLFVIVILLVYMVLKMNTCRSLNRTIKWVGIISLGFQSTWYVVDCIYFFNRNNESCNRHIPLYSFAICMMFLHPLILGCGLINLHYFIQSDFYQFDTSHSQRLNHDYANMIV